MLFFCFKKSVKVMQMFSDLWLPLICFTSITSVSICQHSPLKIRIFLFVKNSVSIKMKTFRPSKYFVFGTGTMTFEESEKLFFTSLLKINKYFLGKALMLWWFTIAGGEFSQTNDFSLNETQWSYFACGSIEVKEQTIKILLLTIKEKCSNSKEN